MMLALNPCLHSNDSKYPCVSSDDRQDPCFCRDDNSTFIIRYHEIALKGGNRAFFESRLKINLTRALEGFEDVKIIKHRDQFEVECLPDDVEKVTSRLGDVFGIAYFALIHSVPPDLDGVSEKAILLIREMLQSRRFVDVSPQSISFKVEVRRSDKDFPHSSVDLEKMLSARILPYFSQFRVQLKNPEFTMHVDWRKDEARLFSQKHPGLGGLPVGSSGKVVSLLSAGFDSPVASFMMMKRGASVCFVHFHSYPQTSTHSIENVKQLVTILNRYQFESRLYLIPLVDYQKWVVAKADPPLRVLLYRRMMLRLAELVRRREGAKAFITGESLAQVASQTLDNLQVVDVLAQRPMLRPLIGMDKEEIIRKAREIGTADISSQPYEDCCSLFIPKSPAIFASVEQLEEAEAGLEVEKYVEELWGKKEVVKIGG